MDRVGALGPALRAGMLHEGRAWPLGAQVRDGGVNFAVCSGHASAIELCLFDPADPDREVERLALPGRTGDVFHGFLPGAAAGLVYGLRAHGPWLPQRGHRFNAHKLLLDPWGREIVAPAGGFSWHGPHYGHELQHPGHLDARDNARWAHKSRVVAPGSEGFDWQGTAHPRTPWRDTVLYELHVRSFTQLMEGVPEPLRGTYAGLAHDAAIAHLQRLGVTAVSLLPVQQLLSEARLADHGLVNHWGYNTLGFFCPEPRYAAARTPAGARQEFRTLVRRLHAAGIEVVLDVVYNHSCEGDERGATLCWRGLDNAGYYRLRPDAREHCENWTGCGNTFHLHHPRVLQMVLDSLRHWVQDYQVDGFRFDLAPVLGRGAHDFEREGAFFKAVQQDPLLAGCKLIAEPWDIGPGGYQVGHFPRGWAEWNDKFRDTARAFWLGGDCTRGEFALRLAGSSDLYQARQRSPQESVNYVVSHDGFTLHDLVSYDFKHNEANLEDNRDGHGHNLSWNCGWEGPTTDPAVRALRARLKRALLATVLLAQGTPMLAAGDELGHTQQGNNNPYCQDNEITWIAWAKADESLIAFTAHVLALRRRLLPLGTQWYSGIADSHGIADLAWLRRVGQPMEPRHWDNRMSRIMGAWIGKPGGGGAPLLLLINGRDMDASFVLPPGGWVAELDTTQPDGRSTWRRESGAAHDAPYLLPARSIVLLQALPPRSRDDAGPGLHAPATAPTGNAP